LPIKASVLFSDLGPPGDAYSTNGGWSVQYDVEGAISNTNAELFSVAGIGSEVISEIDLAVSRVSATNIHNTFYASIWTDNSGLPGAQVANAYWSLSTSTYGGSCCSLVSITNTAGVTLDGGQQYFMILGPLPLSTSDFVYTYWNHNNQGVSGLVLLSTNGGTTWFSEGVTGLGAFDVLSSTSSIPEPGSVLLFGTGLIGMLAARRIRRHGCRRFVILPVGSSSTATNCAGNSAGIEVRVG
jgi:hypothetical protein